MYKSGYFISIGAGKNQLPLILKAKEIGLKVIAIDLNQKAPGFAISEIRIVQSITEYRKIYSVLLKLFLDEPIVGIGVRSYGIAVLTASYLAEKLNLLGTSIDVLKKFYNKKLMKAYLSKNGVLVPKSYTWKDTVEIKSLSRSIKFPCILKPVNNISKKGIEILKNPETFAQRLNELDKENENYLLEEFIEGNEITVLGFVQNSKFQLVSISDKITTKYPPFLELSHRLPSTHTRILGEVKLICQNIIDKTGLENSPIVAEFKINSLSEVYLIEIMPEIGGEYIADNLITEFYSYDYFKNYIYLMTGNPTTKVDSKIVKKQISQICFIAPPEGVSKFVSNNTLVLEPVNKVFLNQQLKEVGENLDTKDGNSCRVQVFGLSSSNTNSPEELDFNIRKSYNAKFE